MKNNKKNISIVSCDIIIFFQILLKYISFMNELVIVENGKHFKLTLEICLSKD